ncbi:MAG: sulfite exporter TauE/SafE family protein [Anaerolineae bacterium]|uniref:sulfite exporter TauE/SafE family protein n=1 Tax=Candidatus Amarolinea dominans TaxID=3140696 RepID=UPI001DB1CB70|nr:sulfite exporter TauE/SafE family protein [Anaerolineae bacterium]MBK7203740.1 sulfite exporter TauE/SafE family protein [Anaerolineae bacterium]MBK9230381.1 sulfite exporter TauE/SafE family protein [Anaerolineae bacterium]
MDIQNIPIWAFILVGFVAQMIDGALGMAYGVSSTTVLVSLGVPQKFASAAVHASEVVTTGISGLSHWRAGNIHFDLAKNLLIPGVLGGVIGAYLLSNFEGDIIKPFVAVYLIIMGLIIIFRAFRSLAPREVRSWLLPLALGGGFMDAVGGGGWGPIVTSTLVARGNIPRFTVGSVNATEFFVTLAQSITFVIALGSGEFIKYGTVILGLLIGGAIAAPLAAFATKRLPHRPFMLLVGLLIVVLNVRTLILTLQ